LLALYLASFITPGVYGDGAVVPGIGLFLLTLIGAVIMPGLFLFWVANPLFWFGVSSLGRGRFGRAAVSGCAACFSALLPLIAMPGGSFREDPGRLLGLAPYFAWLASIVGLAAAGLSGWWTGLRRRRPQFRLRTLMIVILLVALGLALAPGLYSVLRRALEPPGFYVGGFLAPVGLGFARGIRRPHIARTIRHPSGS
jgi:hypothetical protein